MKDEKTTIVVRKTTRNELAKLGSKDETFDEIIQKLLKERNK